MARTIGRPDVWGAAFDKALQELWTEKAVKPPAAHPRSASARELEDALQTLQLPLEFRGRRRRCRRSCCSSRATAAGRRSTRTRPSSSSRRDVGVVGVSSLRYFWNAKPPAQVAADIRRLVAVLAASGKPIFVGGFSFGAEVVPVSLREWSPRSGGS